MPIIDVEDADNRTCPFNKFAPCQGSRCMAWIWTERPFDYVETDNLRETEAGITPIGEPAMPEGEGWEPDGPTRQKGYHRSAKDNLPPGTSQQWKRKRVVQQGCCGRVGTNDPY